MGKRSEARRSVSLDRFMSAGLTCGCPRFHISLQAEEAANNSDPGPICRSPKVPAALALPAWVRLVIFAPGADFGQPFGDALLHAASRGLVKRAAPEAVRQA